MSVHIRKHIVVSPSPEIVKINQPILAWESIVSEGRVSATSEESDNPVTNLANPSTAFVWRATSTSQQDVTVQNDAVIDYIGIARHNLSGNAEIRIQFESSGTFFTILDWSTVDNRQVLLFRISEASPDSIKISIRNNSEPPIIAVLYAGQAMELERNIYVGHTPITMGRDVTTIGGYSENGQYIGEIVRREGRSNSVTLQNLTPDWYRGNLDRFVRQRPRKPAFFAWRPDTYSDEVGYVWLAGSPKPSNQRPNGMMQITLDFQGLA